MPYLEWSGQQGVPSSAQWWVQQAQGSGRELPHLPPGISVADHAVQQTAEGRQGKYHPSERENDCWPHTGPEDSPTRDESVG